MGFHIRKERYQALRTAVIIFFVLVGFPAMIAIEKSWGSDLPWPGGSEATRVDITQPDMGGNMSGVVWNDKTGKLWLVSNSGIFWRMSCLPGADPALPSSWVVDTDGGYTAKWNVGGDTEAITQADWSEEAVFVGVERYSGNHRLIREYDVSGDLGTVSLTNTWDLSEMQTGSSNSGLEALTFVPDRWLRNKEFVDQKGNQYFGSVYGTGGLFFAGLQDNAHVHVFDLDRNPASPQGTYTFVGEYTTGQTEIAGLEFDRSAGVLFSYHNYNWRHSDPEDRLQALSISAAGAGTVKAFPTIFCWLGPRIENNEGIALAPDACSAASTTRFFFLTTDDGGTGDSVGIYPLFPCSRWRMSVPKK